jgi:hypothetical protein
MKPDRAPEIVRGTLRTTDVQAVRMPPGDEWVDAYR